MTELLIVGSGPAGLAAATTAGRHGVDVRLLEAAGIGGELVNRAQIENVPGLPAVTGPELRSTLVEQVQENDVPITLAAVTGIEVGETFHVETTDGTVAGNAIIVATGGSPVMPDLPGIDAFSGMGVFHCAMCDGPLYEGETVAVLGNGEWAVADAVYLTDYAEQVLLLPGASELDGAPALLETAGETETLDILYGKTLVELDGDETLERIKLRDRHAETTAWYEVAGLEVQQDRNPVSGFLPEAVSTTSDGAIEVDSRLESSVSGLFAAGDVRQGSSETVAGALGDGVTASHAAISHLAGHD